MKGGRPICHPRSPTARDRGHPQTSTSSTWFEDLTGIGATRQTKTCLQRSRLPPQTKARLRGSGLRKKPLEVSVYSNPENAHRQQSPIDLQSSARLRTKSGYRHRYCGDFFVRKLFLLLLMQLLSSIAMALPHAVKDGPVVHLDSGSVRGYFQGTTSIFKGIPYAAPPVGKLRWREPQPVSPWSGVRDATAPAHACVQNIAGIDSFMKPLATAYGASYAV